MVEGVSKVAELISQAITGVFVENEIGAFWLTLVIVIIVIIFIVHKLLNRDD